MSVPYRKPLRLLSLVLPLALGACHSWYTPVIAPAAVVDSLHPSGIRVTTVAGDRVGLWHPSLQGDTIEGKRASHLTSDSAEAAVARLPLPEVTRIEVRRGNALKTVGLAYLIVLAFAIPFAIGSGSSW